eukprot:217706-Rhodomonas_salina.1
MAVMQIDISIVWEGEADTGEDVEWVNLSGEIWYLSNIAKDHDYGGHWRAATKQWLSISVDALPKLLQTVYNHCYPLRLTGNFNFDGCASIFIGSHGGYIQDDIYKWSLHQVVTVH